MVDMNAGENGQSQFLFSKSGLTVQAVWGETVLRTFGKKVFRQVLSCSKKPFKLLQSGLQHSRWSATYPWKLGWDFGWDNV